MSFRLRCVHFKISSFTVITLGIFHFRGEVGRTGGMAVHPTDVPVSARDVFK